MINLTVVEDNVTITVSEVGPTGPAGQGVPTGGTTGQVLTKTSATNYATTWTTNGSGTVTSVGITESSAALNITGSPVTSSGNINIGFAGTSAQYVAGDGSLVTFPTTFDEAKRLVTQVTNRSGATMTKGTIVYINGAQGNLPTIAKAIATSDIYSAQTFGFLQTDIANNASGYVVIAGKLDNLDTQSVAEGAQLYLSSTIAGAYTTTKQYAPAHLVYVGVVVRSHPTLGSIEVKIQNGYELDEIHNVSAQTPSNNDGIFFNTSTQLWENKSINTVLGVTPIGLTSLSGVAPVSYNNTNGQISMAASNGTVPGYLTTTDWNTFNNKISSTRTIATSAPLQGGGNLTANRTLSITQADVSTDGYLSASDWSLFNNKVSSTRQITTTAPLTGGGDLSDNITVGITAASSLTSGYITSSDYVDFKNSIKQFGNETLGYITKYTGDNTIGNSSIYESGGTLFLPSSVNQSGLGNSKAVVTDGSGNTVSATIGSGLSLSGGVLTATGTASGSIGGSGTINYIPKFTGTAAIGNSNITDSGSLITLGSNTYISSGGLGIGTSTITGYILNIAKNITGATTSYGVRVQGTVQSDVTTLAAGYGSLLNTAAASFTLTDYVHHRSMQGTIGAGSVVTNQYGYYADSSMIGATNNYAFYSGIASGTNRWNIYMNGNAANYLSGVLNIGSTTLSGFKLDVTGTTRFVGTTASDTAPLGSELANVLGTGTNWTLVGTDLSVGGYTHTTGSVVALTTSLAAVNGTYYQIAYTITGRTAGTITIAYGGTSTTVSATGATGPLASSTAVLTITPTTDFDGTVVLSIKTISQSAALSTFASSGLVIATEIRASDISTNLFFGRNSGRRNTTGTNNTFVGSQSGINNTTGNFNTFLGQGAGVQNSIGNGNTLLGINTGNVNTTGGNNTFVGAFVGQNNTTGGSNTAVGYNAFINNTTGGSNVAIGLQAGRYIADGATAATILNNSILIGQNTKVLADNQTNQIVIGYNQTGLGSNTTVIGNSSTTQTALYGSLTLGTTSTTATALLSMSSTTQGFLPPVMTTAQKNAISSPAAGLIVFDTTLAKLCVYSGSAWQTITSV